jgi:alpha-tubulin suppressor-like RCC1 family protein
LCLTWGEDVGGCTGHGESGLNRIHNTPKWMYWMTNATTKVVSCAAGSAHTVITTGSGQVYTFGVGDCGQLGHGDGVNYAKPKLVESVTLMNVSSVACGSNHTLVVTDSGYVYGFGSNSCGQLGCGDFSNIFIPRRPARPCDEPFATPHSFRLRL